MRGLIKEKKLDINKIKGTGEGGRILEADVLALSTSDKKSKTEDKK